MGAVTGESGQSDPDEYFTCRLHATVHFKLIPALIPAPNPRQWLNFLKESKTDGSLSLTTSGQLGPGRGAPVWKANVLCSVAGVIVSHAQLFFRLCSPPSQPPTPRASPSWDANVNRENHPSVVRQEKQQQTAAVCLPPYIISFLPKDEIEFLSRYEIWVPRWSCQSQMFFLTCLWLHVVMRKTEEWSFNVCQRADCAADSDRCFRGLLNLSSVQLVLFCSCERESRE